MHPQLTLGLGLPDYARFESFYPGPNRELVEVLRGLLRGGAERFVYCAGPVGMGKTHLLQAACAEASRTGHSAQYLPLRELRDQAGDILTGLESLDLVCLDDLDAIAGAPSWEQHLFDLYNRLKDGTGRLVSAAADLPQAVGFQLPDLVSRLRWGLVYPLRSLDDDQRLAALQLRARRRGFDLPAQTGRYLLRRRPRDLPALFRLLDRLDEASLASQRRLTIPFVRTVLAD